MLNRSIAALAFGLFMAVITGPPAHAGAIYSLFVGIGEYAYQNPPHADADVQRLIGPKTDVGRIEQVLKTRFGVPLDHQHMIQLIDAQASRNAIGESLNKLILRAAQEKNSTVLFYYSGHGAQVKDLTGHQITGLSSTIVPQDARTPGYGGDILDEELKPIFAAANRLGVSVVTIFDSCNSATATRGVSKVRAAAPLDRSGRKIPDALPIPRLPRGFTMGSITLGVQVHLAAAQDGEAAVERADEKNVTRGVFTEALASTLLDPHSGVTYEDIFAETSRKLRALGEPQHPHAEGPLDAPFLGDARVQPVLYRAVRSADGAYTVQGGLLAGVTAGSQFEVFGSSTAAISGRPIGTARVIETGPYSAAIDFGVGVKDPPGDPLFLREIFHKYDTPPLRVMVDVSTPSRVSSDRALADHIRDVVRGLAVAHLSSDPQILISTRFQQGMDTLVLESPEAVPLVNCPGTNDDLTAGLDGCIDVVAHYQALLALVRPNEGPKVEIALGRQGCGKMTACKSVERLDGDYVFDDGDEIEVTMTNRDIEPLYVYVLDLGSDYSVRPLYPPSSREGDLSQTDEAKLKPMKIGGQGVSLDAGQAFFPRLTCELPKADRVARLNMPERDYLVLIASDQPVPVANWTMSGLQRTRSVTDAGPSDMINALEQQAASKNAKWKVTLVTTRVRPPKDMRVCPGD